MSLPRGWAPIAVATQQLSQHPAVKAETMCSVLPFQEELARTDAVVLGLAGGHGRQLGRFCACLPRLSDHGLDLGTALGEGANDLSGYALDVGCAILYR
jgi:hypothetical protein